MQLVSQNVRYFLSHTEEKFVMNKSHPQRYDREVHNVMIGKVSLPALTSCVAFLMELIRTSFCFALLCFCIDLSCVVCTDFTLTARRPFQVATLVDMK